MAYAINWPGTPAILWAAGRLSIDPDEQWLESLAKRTGTHVTGSLTMTSRSLVGRGMFYHRDSGGEHETTPGQYVLWAARKAADLGVEFDGTPEDISVLMQSGAPCKGSLFLDYCVKGNQLTRNGLDELVRTVKSDKSISHVFIERRDRLARPDDPMDGIRLENELRKAGVHIVFRNLTLAPMKLRQRHDISESIVGLIEYEKAGKDRTILAQQIISSQIALASAGFATGGRPPYGFDRFLVRADGERIRKLMEGETVKMAGHHVIWYPAPDDDPRWLIVKRILTMLESMPSSRVAAQLTNEGVKPPDHGRMRRDRGVLHKTSGVWHATTVTNIARNPLLMAVVRHGRRSMGDVFRLTPNGPRELTEFDDRSDGKPKVVMNPLENQVIGKAHFAPPTDMERHQRLLAELDRRGESQRGKPRSRNPNRNPLGARIFDMGCTWPMYRQPYGASFRYLCGLYQQSHGAECAHNHVDGPMATKFVLNCLQQRIFTPPRLAKLKEKLRSIAERELSRSPIESDVSAKKAALAEVQRNKNKVAGNMALADTPEQLSAMKVVFNALSEKESDLAISVNNAEATMDGPALDINEEVAAAMAGLDRISAIVQNNDLGLTATRQLFDQINAKIFLRFAAVKVKNRLLNKVAGGVVTFGTTPPPIMPYKGPTGRRALGDSQVSVGNGPPSTEVDLEVSICTGLEGESLGNVNRGERI